MQLLSQFMAGTIVFLAATMISRSEIKISVERNEGDNATARFKFNTIAPPSKSDAATKAKFILVDGRRDSNGGDLSILHDGAGPREEDQPSANFFFGAGTAGGRLVVDLGDMVDMKQVNSYSWHANTRGPQVYHLYASDGQAGEFSARPGNGIDPLTCGWKRLAQVDTRPPNGEVGGQYGVSIFDSNGALGKYRYLLFDILRTEDADAFGNTFYSEIDVIDMNAPVVAVAAPVAEPGGKEIVEAEDGKYKITLDTSDTPDLTEWAHTALAPVVKEWYPKLVQLLPSPGYEAPKQVSIVFRADMQGVAGTSGTRIRCAAPWFRNNLKGEAVGAIVHELMHVVQNYGLARRANPRAIRPPGWLVEGMTDYMRWFIYEPQTHGAEITKRNLARARYDASYRITGNFLNWVTGKYNSELVPQLNAAIRQGQYSEELWTKLTRHTVQELGAEWKAALEKKIAEEDTAR